MTEEGKDVAAFLEELGGFAQIAADSLDRGVRDVEREDQCLSNFAEQMIAIRGTALQLGLPEIARFAGMGEEIARRGSQSVSRPHVRGCLEALWDAVTTVRHMIAHPEKDMSEENEILFTRLSKTLDRLGGATPKVSDDEIARLLREAKQ